MIIFSFHVVFNSPLGVQSSFFTPTQMRFVERTIPAEKYQLIGFQGPFKFEYHHGHENAPFWNITHRFAKQFQKTIQRMFVTICLKHILNA